MKILILVLFAFLIPLNDSKAITIDGVKITSIKRDGGRSFEATVTKEFNLSAKEAARRAISFEEKCNNDLKRKRKLVAREKICRYPNKNVIEAVKFKSLKKCNQCFIVFRRIYNRSYFQHYDLITQTVSKDGAILITHRMLPENEINGFIKTPKKSRSAFDEVEGVFKIISIGESKSKVEYTYKSFTTNWFLNLDLSQETILTNMAKGTLTAINGVNTP